jgi:hypothetical protein
MALLLAVTVRLPGSNEEMIENILLSPQSLRHFGAARIPFMTFPDFPCFWPVFLKSLPRLSSVFISPPKRSTSW